MSKKFVFQDPFGRFIVLYSYHAQDENDLTVERGQCVTVLNKVHNTPDVLQKAVPEFIGPVFTKKAQNAHFQ
jgi:hypothetical protein